MGSKSNAFETLILSHIFNNTTVPGIGDATGLRGSSTAGSLYIGLANNTQQVNDINSGQEAQYSGYSRIAVSRSSGGWVVTGNQVYNKEHISFPTCISGNETIRYVNIFTASSGGTRLYWGILNDDLLVTTDVKPNFSPGSLTIITN